MNCPLPWFLVQPGQQIESGFRLDLLRVPGGIAGRLLTRRAKSSRFESDKGRVAPHH